MVNRWSSIHYGAFTYVCARQRWYIPIFLIKYVFMLEMAGGKKACNNVRLDKFGQHVLQLQVSYVIFRVVVVQVPQQLFAHRSALTRAGCGRKKQLSTVL